MNPSGFYVDPMNPSGFYVDPDNARSERAQKKIPLRNNLRGIIEVPGGFEPPYTVLQTAD